MRRHGRITHPARVPRRPAPTGSPSQRRGQAFRAPPSRRSRRTHRLAHTFADAQRRTPSAAAAVIVGRSSRPVHEPAVDRSFAPPESGPATASTAFLAQRPTCRASKRVQVIPPAAFQPAGACRQRRPQGSACSTGAARTGIQTPALAPGRIGRDATQSPRENGRVGTAQPGSTVTNPPLSSSPVSRKQPWGRPPRRHP